MQADIEGYVRLPGDVVIAWGKLANIGNKFTYVRFPVPISNCFVATSFGKTDILNFSPYDAMLTVNQLNENGFYIGRSENSSNVYTCWIAIGY